MSYNHWYIPLNLMVRFLMGSVVHVNGSLGFVKGTEFLDKLSDYQRLKNNSTFRS
jgi:hypothetical protein